MFKILAYQTCSLFSWCWPLSTSDLDTLNVPIAVRETLFNRCWALLHEEPPPEKKEERLIDLRQSDDVTLEAMVVRSFVGLLKNMIFPTSPGIILPVKPHEKEHS